MKRSTKARPSAARQSPRTRERAKRQGTQEEYESLRDELRQLAPFVDAYAGQRSRLRWAFWNAGLFDDSPDYYEATIEKLQEARAAFFNLHPSEQSAILNGWTLHEERPSNQELADAVNRQGVRSVLELSLFRSDRVIARRSFSTEIGIDSTPLSLVIQEGTEKAEVLRLLEDAKRIIREGWSAMIGEDHNTGDIATMVRRGHSVGEATVALAKEKSGSSPTLLTRKLGGIESEQTKAATTAAA